MYVGKNNKKTFIDYNLHIRMHELRYVNVIKIHI